MADDREEPSSAPPPAQESGPAPESMADPRLVKIIQRERQDAREVR